MNEATYPVAEASASRPTALMPVLSIEQMVARHNAIVDCAQKVLREGPDYGVMPNSKGVRGEAPRKVLFKPGAEKLSSFFGLVPDFQEDKVVIDFDKGLFLFSYRCVLLRAAEQELTPSGKVVTVGKIVGTGIGSANSREKKYLRGARACPDCGTAAVKRSKYPPRDDPGAAPGWYCHDKGGGCGSNFPADDPRILESSNTVNADEAADLINTLQKMACKRALVAAVLVAVGASDLFTQDVIEEEEPRAKAERPAAPPGFDAETRAADAKFSAEGLFPPGELVKAVQALGISKGWGSDLARWPASAHAAGFAHGKDYVKKARAAKQAPAPPAPSYDDSDSDSVVAADLRPLYDQLRRVGMDERVVLDMIAGEFPDGPRPRRLSELTKTQLARILVVLSEEPDFAKA